MHDVWELSNLSTKLLILKSLSLVHTTLHVSKERMMTCFTHTHTHTSVLKYKRQTNQTYPCGCVVNLGLIETKLSKAIVTWAMRYNVAKATITTSKPTIPGTQANSVELRIETYSTMS